MRQWRLVAVGALVAIIMLTGPGGIAQGQNEITLTLTALTLNIDGPGVMEAQVACPTPCESFSVTLSFDPAVVRVDSVFPGPFLGTDARLDAMVIDNISGVLRFQIIAPTPPADPEGLLFLLNVTGRANGTSPVEFMTLEAAGPGGASLVARGVASSIIVGTGMAELPPTDEIGRLVFVSERDDNREIYAMNVDGSGLERLTDDPAIDEYPVWSPDGLQIVFVSNRTGSMDLYIMKADGSDLRQLTQHPGLDSYPAWSPDGRQIAYASDRGGSFAIYLLSPGDDNPDATAQLLTGGASNNLMPAWSPDGRRIAFVSDRDGSHEIYLMNADGSGVTRLTNGFGANSWFPMWSPDGARIAFNYERDGQGELFSMTPEGDDIRPMDIRPGWVGRMDWSPDGAEVVYAGTEGGGTDLFVASVPVTEPERLTDLPTEDFDPDWRPAMTVVAVPPAAPCRIWATRVDVPVRVGPGTSRSIFDYLPQDQKIGVTGQAVEGGGVWWQIDKTALTASPGVTSLWVAQRDVAQEGDCALVAQAEAPPVVYTPPQTTGIWQPCGSCNVCGGPPAECQINPEGSCVWNPALCRPPDTGGNPPPAELPPTAPVASFSFSIQHCGRVTFTNSSTNATSYFWNFGDGTTSTATNPFHIYPQSEGNHTYIASLTAYGPGGSNMTSRTVQFNCLF